MDEAQLKKILQSREVAPDDNARKAAVNLALAEFDAVRAQRNNISQGSSFWARLTSRSNKNERREPMNKKLVYGGMATAMVVVMAAALSLQTPIGGEQMSRVSEAKHDISKSYENPVASHGNITQDYEEAVKDYNVTPDERVKKEAEQQADAVYGVQRGNSALPVPFGTVPTEGQRQAYEANKPKKDSERADPAKSGRAEAEVDSSVVAVAPPPATLGQPMQYEGLTAGSMTGQAPRAEARRKAPSAAAPMEMAKIYMPEPDDNPDYYQDKGRDNFEDVQINAVKQVAAEPVSTFSIDTDTASYSVVRRMINNGSLPPADAVRIEELVNYFGYDYQVPSDKAQPFMPVVTLLDSPWAEGRKLMHVAIKGYDIDKTAQPHSNLVFLIDVSGSMDSPDKLPLLKSSMKMLLGTLKPDDTVAIVTYAGNAGTVIEPTKVSERAKIEAAIDNLNPGGGTAGAAGIEQAYKLAEANLDKEGVNRVILATDGDFNIGASDTESLKTMIEEKRKSGVFLSVLGFGMGNLNDHMMQTLAQNGNGTAAYIDNLNEARKVLVEEASSTLFPIAKDVKIQVEFNPATVAEYRLIGYETRALNREDFNNDAIDAGEVGAGTAVTAIYEITPVGGPVLVDQNRYGAKPVAADKGAESTEFGNEYAFLKLRYKLPNGDVSKLMSTPVTTANQSANPGADVKWAAAVAGYGQLLKGGQYMTGFGYDDVLKLAQEAKGTDADGYRAEFINMVKLTDTLAK